MTAFIRSLAFGSTHRSSLTPPSIPPPPLPLLPDQVNTIISRVTGRDRAKFEAKFAKKSKAEDAYHEKKEYVQEL